MTATQNDKNNLSFSELEELFNTIPEETPISKSIYDKLQRQIKSSAREEMNQERRKYSRCWDALLAWRDQLKESKIQKSTKKNYLAGMAVLIDEEVVDPKVQLTLITAEWKQKAIEKIDSITKWSKQTKASRKSCLESFLSFARNFTPTSSDIKHGRQIPEKGMVHHILSDVEEKVKAQKLQNDVWTKFILQLWKINRRDSLICLITILSGKTIAEVLTLQPHNIQFNEIKWDDGSVTHLEDYLAKIFQDLSTFPGYIFCTESGKRVMRNQIVRTLKKASKMLHLDFEITPKILQGYSISRMESSKRTLIEKALGHVANK